MEEEEHGEKFEAADGQVELEIPSPRQTPGREVSRSYRLQVAC